MDTEQDVYVTARRNTIDRHVVPVSDCRGFVDRLCERVGRGIIVEHTSFGCEQTPQTIIYVGSRARKSVRDYLGIAIPTEQPMPRSLCTNKGMRAYVFRQEHPYFFFFFPKGI